MSPASGQAAKLKRDQTGNWMPQLANQNLTPQTLNAITQAYLLLYSQRDSVNRLANAVSSTIGYATHSQRQNFDKLNTSAVGVPDGALLYETDRATVFYQARVNPQTATEQWFYAGGIYVDLFQNRPTDLGLNDKGFLFLSRDSHILFQWDTTTMTWITLLP